MVIILPKTVGIYKERELLTSEAYWELTGTEIRILEVFKMKCRIVDTKEARKTKTPRGTIKNNGQLVFTYGEAMSYGISQATFTRVIDKLLKLGFIDITIPGRQSTPTRYSVSERWKHYGEKDFVSKKRKKRKNYKPGKGTRFCNLAEKNLTRKNDSLKLSKMIVCEKSLHSIMIVNKTFKNELKALNINEL
ncbi:hypothetical protein ES708_20165 [subsurface metagenome]